MKRREYIPFHKRMGTGFIAWTKLSIIEGFFYLFYLLLSLFLNSMHELICLHVGENLCRRAQMRQSFI